MAKAKVKGRVRRDKYGRFKGDGAIKPFKSNLAGVTRLGAGNKTKRSAAKRSNRRRNVAIGVVATAAVVGGAVYVEHKTKIGQKTIEAIKRQRELRTFDRNMAAGVRPVGLINAISDAQRRMSPRVPTVAQAERLRTARMLHQARNVAAANAARRAVRHNQTLMDMRVRAANRANGRVW